MHTWYNIISQGQKTQGLKVSNSLSDTQQSVFEAVLTGSGENLFIKDKRALVQKRKRRKGRSLQTQFLSTCLHFGASEEQPLQLFQRVGLTSWQYWRIPSFVPMQVLVPEGSDSHFPFWTFMCMLSFPQNMAIWGSASNPAFPSAGTWKKKKNTHTYFNLASDSSVLPNHEQFTQAWIKLQAYPPTAAKAEIVWFRQIWKTNVVFMETQACNSITEFKAVSKLFWGWKLSSYQLGLKTEQRAYFERDYRNPIFQRHLEYWKAGGVTNNEQTSNKLSSRVS